MLNEYYLDKFFIVFLFYKNNLRKNNVFYLFKKINIKYFEENVPHFLKNLNNQI